MALKIRSRVIFFDKSHVCAIARDAPPVVFFSSCFEDVSQDFVQGRLLGCPIENQTYLKRRSASYVGKTAKIFLEAESEDTT